MDNTKEIINDSYDMIPYYHTTVYTVFMVFLLFIIIVFMMMMVFYIKINYYYTVHFILKKFIFTYNNIKFKVR